MMFSIIGNPLIKLLNKAKKSENGFFLALFILGLVFTSLLFTLLDANIDNIADMVVSVCRHGDADIEFENDSLTETEGMIYSNPISFENVKLLIHCKDIEN